MNKLLAGLQIILGGLATFAAWYLGDEMGWPAYVSNTGGSHGIILDSIPPDFTLEEFLMYVGLAVFILAMAQATRRMRFSYLQMVCGVAIIGIMAFLYGRVTAFSYGIESRIFRISYLTMAVGIVVAMTGIIQLIKEIIPYPNGLTRGAI